MALNPQLLPNGLPVPFENEMFVLSRDGVEFEIDKIPGFVLAFTFQFNHPIVSFSLIVILISVVFITLAYLWRNNMCYWSSPFLSSVKILIFSNNKLEILLILWRVTCNSLTQEKLGIINWDLFIFPELPFNFA